MPENQARQLFETQESFKRKQNELWYQKNLRKFDRSTKLDFKFIETILRGFANLDLLLKGTDR